MQPLLFQVCEIFSKNCPGFFFFFFCNINNMTQPTRRGWHGTQPVAIRKNHIFFHVAQVKKSFQIWDCHFGPFWKDLPSTVWPCHVVFHVLLCLTKNYLVDSWKLIPPDYMLTWWDPSRISRTSSAAWWSLVQSGFSLGLRWLPTWFWSTWMCFWFLLRILPW